MKTVTHSVWAMTKDGTWYAWSDNGWAASEPKMLSQENAVNLANRVFPEVGWIWGVAIVTGDRKPTSP